MNHHASQRIAFSYWTWLCFSSFSLIFSFLLHGRHTSDCLQLSFPHSRRRTCHSTRKKPFSTCAKIQWKQATSSFKREEEITTREQKLDNLKHNDCQNALFALMEFASQSTFWGSSATFHVAEHGFMILEPQRCTSTTMAWLHFQWKSMFSPRMQIVEPSHGCGHSALGGGHGFLFLRKSTFPQEHRTWSQATVMGISCSGGNSNFCFERKTEIHVPPRMPNVHNCGATEVRFHDHEATKVHFHNRGATGVWVP